MAFRRALLPPELLSGEELTSAMVGIGMVFEAPAPGYEPNIEDTLIAASYEAMERDDLRVLDLLVTWLENHYPWLNADRLVRSASELGSVRVRSFWAAVGAWLESDRRLARLKALVHGQPTDLLRTGSAFQLQRRGQDARFEGSALRVPAGILRGRAEDVLPPSELAKRHRAYRLRVMMGPSYRADMWAVLDEDPRLSPADVARRTYGSFATAWQVKRDRGMIA